MAWLSLVISLGSLIGVVYFYRRFKKQQEVSMESLSNRVSNLLTEFNKVSSDNIDMLEEQTDDLRRVIELANLKIEKLNKLIDQAEGHRRLPEDDAGEEVEESDRRQVREEVLRLSEEGLGEEEIAEETGLQPREVAVMIRLHKSGAGTSA